MASSKTCVWIQGSVLSKALGAGGDTDGNSKTIGKKSSDVDLDRSGGDWSWTRCFVKSGDYIAVLNTPNTSLAIDVVDVESEYNEKSTTITHELLKEIQGKSSSAGSTSTPPILMANEWAAADAEGGSSSLGVPPDDLITLTHLHEASVVFCLKKRYEQDLIYTSTGPILIALNPFKEMPGLYDDAVMNDYWLAGEELISTNADNSSQNKLELKPHIYSNAHKAFRSMMQGIEMKMLSMSSSSSSSSSNSEDPIDNTITIDQSMLVSGESGAGKTVTTKHIMKYLATLSQRKAAHAMRRRAASPGRSGDEGRLQRQMSQRVSGFGPAGKRKSRAQSWKVGAQVEEKILESNPILEAFGNARTVRNDNSSRFGKFIELQFKQTGSLIGANINTYLLEKVRLVHQGEGERNFHIFYELLAAANDPEREMFHLGEYTERDFKMTNQSGTYDRRDGVDDAKLYDSLLFSFGTMGFDQDIQKDIISVVAAFLHASNLTFTAPTEETSAVDDTNPHLDPVLKLLGLEKSAFNAAMTEYEIEVGNQSYTRQFTVEGAENTLSSFIKGTYGSMFSFIVGTINKQIDHKPKSGGGVVPKELGKAGSISVLDIFGFESFQLNSFEQLCINYCNEALQQQFNLFIFKSEQEEYKKEGIAWDFIEFPDNMDVMEVIDKNRVGTLAILTDQCRAPRGTDKTFIDAVYKQWGKHDRWLGTPLHQGKMQFIINHYAGPVMYDATDFVEKNKDETPRGASALLESSSNLFVQLLGKISMHGNESAAGSGNRPKKRPTVGSQFSSQLTDLRARIDATTPHYVRCLKPNQSLKAAEFHNAMIADQLRYAGVLEAIRVSRVGYSQRYTKSNFIDRYRYIAPDAIKGIDDAKKVSALNSVVAKKMWEAENPKATAPANIQSTSGIQEGMTKVFLRKSTFEFMEKVRIEMLTGSTLVIQKLVRGFLERCRYHRNVNRIITCQACARRFFARKLMQSYREKKAATCIQGYVRMASKRREFVAKKYASLWLQRLHRGNVARRKYKELHDLNALQYRSAVTIQCMYRIKVARAIYHKKFMEGRGMAGTKTKLEGGALKAVIQADRAAAVAKQAAKDRAKMMHGLETRLEGAEIQAEKAKLALQELEVVKAQLAKALADLDVTKVAFEEANKRVAELEAENIRLKEGGAMLSPLPNGDMPITRNQSYTGHSDLMALDERLQRVVNNSKKSKAEMKALVASLAILK